MSFYEESSIIITPNAYKAGTLYAVVPTSGAADMDVTRATAATRVDESGLVNYAEVLGGELAPPASDITQWDQSSSVTQSGTSFIISTGGYIFENIPLITSGTGKWVIEGSGDIKYRTNTADAYVTVTLPATVYPAFGTPNSRIQLSNSSGSDVTVDNISVKQVDRDNVPRIDYTGGGCPHILAEPQRTNLFPYSEDFTNGVWSKTNATVALSSELSPDGTLNAYKVTATDTNQPRVEDGIPTVAVNTTYTFSFFAKKGNTSFVAASRFSGGQSAIFNLDTGAIVSSTTDDVSITALDNEWFKVSITQEVLSADGYNIWKINLTNGTSSSAGVIGEYVHIYGAQLEEGSYPTSYIPTSGATVTRNQDQFTRDGIGSLINSTEGVLFVEMATLTSVVPLNNWLTITDGTNSNSVGIVFETTGTTTARIESGGVNQAYISKSGDYSIYRKLAFKWKVNDFAFWIDGVEVGSDTGGITFSADTLNSLQLTYGSGGNYTNGKIKQLQVYPTALSDSELTSLTTP